MRLNGPFQLKEDLSTTKVDLEAPPPPGDVDTEAAAHTSRGAGTPRLPDGGDGADRRHRKGGIASLVKSGGIIGFPASRRPPGARYSAPPRENSGQDTCRTRR